MCVCGEWGGAFPGAARVSVCGEWSGAFPGAARVSVCVCVWRVEWYLSWSS